jgi:hypothetical protein
MTEACLAKMEATIKAGQGKMRAEIKTGLEEMKAKVGGQSRKDRDIILYHHVVCKPMFIIISVNTILV